MKNDNPMATPDTQDEDKQKKPTENQKGEQHGPHQNPGCVNPDAREGL